MSQYDGLQTNLIHGRPQSLIDKRCCRIQEAINWEGGSRDNPLKHVVTSLNDGIEVYFLKPGKEVFNEKRPNPYDMTPFVGDSDARFRFDEIWTYLTKISVISFDIFKAVLTLIYRNAYLIDHREEYEEKLRYSPDDEVKTSIDDMDVKVGQVLPTGLWGLLHFLDILGWNEDIKYHTENDVPTFSGHYNFNVGRINTLLTCIRVPYQASSFIKQVIDNHDDLDRVDFLSLYTIMQQFAKSRGTCTPTQRNLTDWLSPHITNIPPENRKLG